MTNSRRRSRPSARRNEKTFKGRARLADRDEQRRRAILAAASEVFLEVGYAAASIDEIIRRVGGSKREIYRYFGSKEKLFAAMIDEFVGEIVKPLPDINATELRVRDTLLLAAVQHMTLVLSERHIALMRLVVAETPRFPEVGRAYYEHGPARGHEKLRLYFEKQRRKGTLKIQNVNRAADYFWGMLLHHATLRCLYQIAGAPSPEQVQSGCAAVVDAFLALYGEKDLSGNRRA